LNYGSKEIAARKYKNMTIGFSSLEDFDPYVKVKAVQDGDGYWYLIPNEKYGEFLNDMDEEDYEVFDDKWDRYRTKGDLNNRQLYIDF
jgi:hypothetical protein